MTRAFKFGLVVAAAVFLGMAAMLIDSTLLAVSHSSANVPMHQVPDYPEENQHRKDANPIRQIGRASCRERV